MKNQVEHLKQWFSAVRLRYLSLSESGFKDILSMQSEGDTFSPAQPLENPWRIKHPVVTFFHLLFRTLALIVYLLCGLTQTTFIESFIAIILLLSLDFWTVKNITGRIMAGYRWWNYVNDDGESVWNFETSKQEDQIKFSRAEIQIFWTGLVLFPIIWVCLLFTAFFTFKLKWIVIVIIALILTGSNLAGYLRCRMGSSMVGAANTYFKDQIRSNMFGMFKSKTNQNPQATTF